MSTESTEQYRAGFEAWFEKWRVSTWRPLPSDIANGKAECPKHWNTNAKRDMEIAWCAAMQQREASTEPSAIRDAALEEADKAVARVLWDIENGKDGLPDEVYGAERCRDAIRALKGGAGALPDEAKAALCDALNTTLWLYRRLPVAYGKPPFVDAAILTMARHLDMADVPDAIKERANLLAHTRAGSGN